MPRAMIIDTDTASDDAVAILMALRHPDIDVKAITVVAGHIQQQADELASPGGMIGMLSESSLLTEETSSRTRELVDTLSGLMGRVNG